MKPDELHAIMEFLSQRVHLRRGGLESGVAIEFAAPTHSEMVEAGLNAAGSRQILAAPWWNEMVNDVVETPEMCEPGDSPEQVLQYARDVVAEYIRKRATL